MPKLIIELNAKNIDDAMDSLNDIEKYKSYIKTVTGGRLEIGKVELIEE